MKKQPQVLQTISFREEDAVKKVNVDFCIRSDILDPTTLSNELGITPSRAWVKDEEYLGKALDKDTRNVVSVKRKRPWGIWAIDTVKSVSSKRVEDHALHLVNMLELQKDTLAKYLQARNDYSVRFFIWWEPPDGHGSYAISSETLVRMANLSHYVEFCCIYTDDVET